MRIETRDLADKNRLPLWELVPLTRPLSMYIDVTNLCNFKCIYCPTGNPQMLRAVSRYTGHMPMSLYKKVVRDMREFDDKINIVNLYKDGDPLVNRNFVEMVHILRDADVTHKIYSKTNGELIPKYKDLAAAPMDMLGISVPHVIEDKFQSVIGKKMNYAKYRDGIKRLFEDSRRKFTLNAKMARYQMTDEDIEKFYQDFEPITDTVAIEGLHGWGAKELGNMFLEDNGPHDGVPINEKIACPNPFIMMSVNSDGTTAVCCAEWGHFHALGDVRKESLKEIFNNKKSIDFRIMHLEGRREENIACKDCQYRNCLPDNIDAHLEEMLIKYKRINHA